jgi:hypothetical protein
LSQCHAALTPVDVRVAGKLNIDLACITGSKNTSV